jgi:aminoglycoside phosphotransferase (APT) family kinase protein
VLRLPQRRPYTWFAVSEGERMSGEQQVIEQHLRLNANRYNPAYDGNTDVSLVRRSQRACARLYWFKIASTAGSQIVIAKVPGATADVPVTPQSPRPYLVEPPLVALKYTREHRALDLLQRNFGNGNAGRFGAVPLLDRVDDARAIIMGQVDGQPMNQFWLQLTRLYPAKPSGVLRTAVENAGAWLRAYHALDLSGTGTRQSQRAEIIELIHRYCDHLGPLLSRVAWFSQLAVRMTRAAQQVLPERLPLGLAHGDFAMRNILVTRGARVTVLDTTALWAAPVYEDLAKFYLALRVSRIQTYSHGLAFSEQRLRLIHSWLLDGYYGAAPVPHDQIRLYELLLLLDKWSFELAQPTNTSRVADFKRRRLNAWLTALVNRSTWLN